MYATQRAGIWLLIRLLFVRKAQTIAEALIISKVIEYHGYICMDKNKLSLNQDGRLMVRENLDYLETDVRLAGKTPLFAKITEPSVIYMETMGVAEGLILGATFN
ncbi:MAG: hypothetical protein FH749_02810 [Firmicutes bacterium]|nr:hypothetical protein [Bacillota bacterium]